MLQIKEPTLLDKILAKDAVVGICGLGYVGLPLALTFGEKGFPVIGFDIDQRKLDAIGKGESYIKHIQSDRIAKATAESRDALSATDRSVAARRARALSDQLDHIALDLYGISDEEERDNVLALGAPRN